MSGTRPAAFAIRGLTKQYDRTTAVADITFTAPCGATTALVGPRGSGKTTILRILLGLTTPTSGTVTIGGPGALRRVAAGPGHVLGGVLTPRGLHPARTARDHLRIYAAAAGVPDARVTEVLEFIGLTGYTEKRIGTLTTGQQTRLALATALLSDPLLLVLDDPMDGLDTGERGWLNDFLHRHTRRGGSAVLSGQSLTAVLPATDNLIVLSEGAVVYRGSPARLRRGYPDRLVVATPSPVALATMLAAQGFTDAVIRADGRLAVAEATETQIRAAAGAARVRVDTIVPDPISPDRVLAALTEPAAAPMPHHPGLTMAGPRQPTPMPYGIQR
ncbi:ATP-binding cassette domain-containing protein [Nocardia sp. 004]|uniref:ATP-binding cassette domain-containing protein n=1 Tax=Nocardia sp. 004 TaxID=3385978 RepID=UPI0039A31AF6